MKKSVNLFQAAGIALCALFALLSLLPCVQVEKLWSPTIPFSEDTVYQSYLGGFAPIASAVISALEIVFLLCKRRGFRIVGAVLVILKAALPLYYYAFLHKVFDLVFTNIGSSTPTITYTLLPLSYVLILIGAVSVVLYILSFLSDKEPSAAPEHRARDPQPVDFEIPER